MVRRIKFWWRAVSRGAGSLNSAAAWLGLIVLMLGIAAGIAVPLVFHVSHWLTAVIVMGVLVVVVLEGSYRVWNATDRERETALAAEAGAAAALESERAKPKGSAGVIIEGGSRNVTWDNKIFFGPPLRE